MNADLSMQDSSLEHDLEDIVSNNIANILISSIKEWDDAEEAATMISASNNFVPHTVISQLQSLISNIELWFMREHNSIITSKAKELKISPSRWLIQSNSSKWLHQELGQNFNAIQHAVTQFDSTIEMVSLFANEHSGLSGFAKDALRGFLNPVDGIMGLFGASSVDKQGQELQKRLDKDRSNMIDSFYALDACIKTSIYNAIHSKTGAAINEMEHFAEEEKQKRNNRVFANDGLYPVSASNKKYPKILALIGAVALLIIIAILVLYVRKSHFFGSSSNELTAIINPTTPFKGPGEQFGTLPQIYQPEAVIILDITVPGWSKVRFSNGSEGWVKSDRILSSSPK
jgi:hypothetical protein